MSNSNFSTDKDWELWGQLDPYYGVLADDCYKKENLSKDSLELFFKSGEHHVKHVIEICRSKLDTQFSPHRIVDFGCGTGRLLIPFAKVGKEVVGIDISTSMLEEAKKNCQEQGLVNVSFLISDDTLTRLKGEYDLIHSTIVLQHIPIERGEKIFFKLFQHIKKNGFGAIQLTYARNKYAHNFGEKPKESMENIVKHQVKLFLSKLGLVTMPRSVGPGMQMNSYPLNRIMYFLQSQGVKDLYTEFTDDGGELGVMLYFKK